MDRKTAVRTTGTAAALVAVTGMALTAPASAKDRRSSVVTVTASGDDLALSRSVVGSSHVTLDLDVTHDGSASLQVLQLRKGVTLPQLIERASVPDPVASTRALDELATWYGGVTVDNGQDDTALSLRLERGTYLVVDLEQLAGGPDALDVRTLRVTSNSGRGGRPTASARVEMDERHGEHGSHEHGHVFEAPDVLPAAGTVEFRNQNSIIHFAEIAPVQPGTTDAQVQAAFDAFAAGQTPTRDPFAGTEGRDAAGMNLLSAGERAHLTYDLPAGTYVLLCFVSDEVNGVPHAFLGMHKVVTLR